MSTFAIVTLTMNPAVDLATEVAAIEPEHKLRCDGARRDAGGGGINVARAIVRLGGSATAIYPSGGATGAALDSLVQAANVHHRVVPIAGETRVDFSVRESTTGRQYRFVLPGPELTENELQACLEALAEHVTSPSIIVASGSLPPNVVATFYANVARAAATREAQFVLDTSGPPLQLALGKGLYLIKPSRRELSELLHEPLDDRAACLEACRRLVRGGGAEFVALSLGEEGALLVGREVALRATAPRVEVLSTVGAGDSFLGGLTYELSRHSSLPEALKTAVAAGTAALLSPGTGLCDAKDVDRLRRLVDVTSLS